MYTFYLSYITCSHIIDSKVQIKYVVTLHGVTCERKHNVMITGVGWVERGKLSFFLELSSAFLGASEKVEFCLSIFKLLGSVQSCF